MLIYFFEVDPETGFFKAGFRTGSVRVVKLIRNQAGQSYVTTGSKRGGDLKRHDFTPAQEAALDEFAKSGEYSREFFPDGI